MSTLSNKSARTIARLAAAAALVAGGFAFAQSPTLPQLRQVVSEDAQDTIGWLNLGDALLAAGEFDEAKAAYLEAIALDYMLGDAHFGLGLAEYNRGDFQAALFSFSEVARLYPERFDGHYNQGVVYARLRMPAEAAEAFRSAVGAVTPDVSLDDEYNAWLGLAGQLRLLDDHVGVAEAYVAALVIKPDDRDVRYLHAEALVDAGMGLEALPLLVELDDEENRDYRVSSLIADIYMEQGQTDYALRALERAIRKAEENGSASVQAGVHIKLGLLQRRLGQGADALASFQRAATVDPASWQAHYNLGLSQLEDGHTAEAIGPLETAVVQAPASAEARLALASAYDQAARPDDALEQADLALGMLTDPQLAAQARFIAGRSHYLQEDYATAAQLLAQVVDARPGDAQAQLWAGLAEYRQGNFAQSIQYFERSVQLNPAGRDARANLAAAYLADERFADAEFIYRELLEQNPADGLSNYNLGWALLSQNRRTDARDAFQAALDNGYAAAGEALETYF